MNVFVVLNRELLVRLELILYAVELLNENTYRN